MGLAPHLQKLVPKEPELVPNLLRPIGAAIDLARHNGRDPTGKIISILESELLSLGDQTKFTMATLLASSPPMPGELHSSVDKRVSQWLDSLSSCIPSLPAGVLLYPMKRTLALNPPISQRPEWIDKGISAIEFTPRAAFRLAKWGIQLPEEWEPILRETSDVPWLAFAVVQLMYSKLRPWDLANHRRHYRPFQRAVYHLVLIHTRLRREEEERTKIKQPEAPTNRVVSFGSLPEMVLHIIFGHLARGYAEISLVDFLLKVARVEKPETVDAVLQDFRSHKTAEGKWSLFAYHSTWNLRKLLVERDRQVAAAKKKQEEDAKLIVPSKMKVADLRQQLKERGLDIKGVKNVLVNRLSEALEKEKEEKEEEAEQEEGEKRK